jgi:DNA-3-methyladenine glycosylase I|tara:strand:- start:3655 stop:4287 length:633 start_codon:yes stop_codon:yes gene_type:complete
MTVRDSSKDGLTKTSKHASINKYRCNWCEGSDLYEDYHDQEWGVPLKDPGALFKLLVLEGMQAGLSWITVLTKREHMHKLFFGFDMSKLAVASADDVKSWLMDAGIIRHRGKLNAMIGNAQCALDIDDFSGFLWQFAPPELLTRKACDVPAQTDESNLMSKALKAKGFRFVGPTICYAFMQSAGMVNDHHPRCWRHINCQKLLKTALAKN